MGTKTYRNSVTQRLLDTENFKSSKDFAMHRYLQERRISLRPSMKEVSMADCLKDAYSGSMPIKFRNAYNFAQDRSRYKYGIPNSTISSSQTADIKDSFITYMEAKEGKPINVIYNRLNSKSIYHYAWKILYDKYLYSGLTNELKRLSIDQGVPCYLVSGQITLTQSSIDVAILEGTTDQRGLAMSYGQTPNRSKDTAREQPEIIIGDSDKLTIVYAYKEGTTLTEETLVIDLTGTIPKVTADSVLAPDEHKYMQVMYEVDGEYKLFTYQYLSGGIPQIDKAMSYQEEFGNYYPRIYTRIDARNLVDMSNIDKGKKDTQKMMTKIGLNLKEVTESLEEGIEGINGDYKYIFLHLTVSINKEMDDVVTGEYLYNYFDALYELSEPVPVADRETPALSNEKSSMTQTVSDVAYTQVINYWKSGKSIRTGIAKNNAGIEMKKGQYCIKYDVKSWGINLWKNNTGKHELIYQNDDNQYTVITILGLEMSHQFDGHYIKADWSDENLTIPLDINVVSKSNPETKEILINKALQITVTTVQVIKKRWYEKGIFKVAIAAISIAINVVVPGSGFTFMALLQAVAVTIVTSIAVDIAMRVALKIGKALGLSPEVLAIITLVAVGVGMTSGKIDFGKLLNAKDMMKAANTAMDMYSRAINEKISEIREKMDDFAEYSKSQWEKLEAAQKMLETGVIPMDLEYLTAPINAANIYLGETVKDFYTRTQLVDIYDITYNSVEYFTEMASSVPINFKPYKPQSSDITDVLLIT